MKDGRVLEVCGVMAANTSFTMQKNKLVIYMTRGIMSKIDCLK